jgi:hypothetical protein
MVLLVPLVGPVLDRLVLLALLMLMVLLVPLVGPLPPGRHRRCAECPPHRQTGTQNLVRKW